MRCVKSDVIGINGVLAASLFLGTAAFVVSVTKPASPYPPEVTTRVTIRPELPLARAGGGAGVPPPHHLNEPSDLYSFGDFVASSSTVSAECDRSQEADQNVEPLPVAHIVAGVPDL